MSCLGKWSVAPLQRYANTAAGHRKLLEALTRGGRRVRVVLEATGMYGLDVALLLSAAEKVEVMVANPRAVRDFAKAMMQRSKNDPLDAVVLREFATRMPFRAWQRPSQNRLALWSITRRIQALNEQCRAEKNRQHAAGISQSTPGCVRRDIVRDLRVQQQAIKKLRQEAQKCLEQEAQLRRSGSERPATTRASTGRSGGATFDYCWLRITPEVVRMPSEQIRRTVLGLAK